MDKTAHFFSKADLSKNKDSNVTLVTGFSGGGKTTLAERLERENPGSAMVELDGFEHGYDSTNEGIVDEFIAQHGNWVENKNVSTRDIMNYILNKAQNDPNRQYVVEGVQLTEFPELFANHSSEVKGTGLFKSSYRKAKREQSEGGSLSKGLVNALVYNRNMNKALDNVRGVVKEAGDNSREGIIAGTLAGAGLTPVLTRLQRKAGAPLDTSALSQFDNVSWENLVDDLKPNAPILRKKIPVNRGSRSTPVYSSNPSNNRIQMYRMQTGDNPIVMAHELGHASGKLALSNDKRLNRLAGLGRGINRKLLSHKHTGIPLAAIGALSADSDGEGYKDKLDTAAKVVSGASLALGAPTLFEEGRASLRGLGAIRRLGGNKAALRSMPSLAGAYGSYLLPAVAPGAAYFTGKKVSEAVKNRNRSDDMMDKVASRTGEEKKNDRLKGLLGTGVVAGSSDALLGKKTLYHGTSKANWENIKQEGLKASKGGTGAATHMPNYIEASKGQTHTTRFKPIANMYANFAGKNEKSMSPKDLLSQGDGKTIKIKADYDKFRKGMALDDFAGEVKKPFQSMAKNMQAKGPVDFSPAEIKGSTATLTERLKHTAKNMPGYVKNNPVRFAAGVAGTALGGKMVYDALRKEKAAKDTLDELYLEKLAAKTKPTYKVRDIGTLDESIEGEVWTAKIDGAHTVIDLQKNRIPRLFSHRLSKKTNAPIEYTDKLPHIKRNQPFNARVRGEVYAVVDGRAVHPDMVTALLNSGQDKSLALQKTHKMQTRTALIDVDEFEGRDLRNASFAEKRAILERIAKEDPDFSLPDTAYTTEDKKKLLNDIVQGRHEQTKEGLVIHDQNSENMPFSKAKIIDHHDVYIRDIFAEEGVKDGRKAMAGGFTYSWEPDGTPVGRVGTGFSHEMKEDMLQNPDKYIGRAAMVKALDVSKNNILVKPSFDGWHVDKNIGEKMASDVLDELYLEKFSALNPDIRLYDHQERFVNKPGPAAIAAHSVGSGKTLSGIARFEKLKEEGKASKALVVVPAGLRENFGEKGIGAFTDSTYNIVGNSAEKQKGVYGDIDPEADYNIVSYEIFRRDPDRLMEMTGADTVITDESHRGKNENTITTDALRGVRDQYKNYIGLTGSVISNRIADVLPLVDLAKGDEHGLGKSKDDFDKKWLVRDNSRKYKDLHEKRRPIIGFNRGKALAKEIGSVVDYVDFDDIKELANMPDKSLKVNRVPISRDQAKAYKKLLSENPAMMKIVRNKRLETLRDEEAAKAFSALIESRKLMNDYGTVKPGLSIYDSVEMTPKTKKLLTDMEKHLETTPDGQALLFTHLIHGGADALEAGLQNRGVEYGRFLGKGNKGITEESRQQDVRDFNDRKKRVMIVSSAGGEGLSLNDTTWEGVLDPHYNPEKMKQMEARGVRSGGLSHRPQSQREVEINRYLATMPRTLGIFKSRTKTPDEVIYQISENKDKQNAMLFNLLKDYQQKAASDALDELVMEKLASK